MFKIYSKKNKKKLLHLIHHKKDFNYRQNLIPKSEFLQVSSLQLSKNQTFKPHYHFFIKNKKKNKIAQESWVVITGKVKVYYYDLDKKLICTKIIKAGDISVTLYGGHNYKALSENTLVYEYKSGPYQGIVNDKKFID